MGEAERGQEADEAGRTRGDSAGSLSGDLEGRRVALGAVRKKSTLREYGEALLIAVILALVIRTFIVQAFKIPSGSMMDTLVVGDHILVNKFIYGVKIPFTDQIIIPVSNPDRGDVIVFKFPNDESKDFIKRVIGEPGDTVEIRDKKVYVNGDTFTEPYAVYRDPISFAEHSDPRDNYGPVTVPQGAYFVMGDNRDRSQDSRYWGFVKRKKIKGKAFMIYWSWDKSKYWPRWNRIAKGIR